MSRYGSYDPWIGVDLDGTLATYYGPGPGIGAPIPLMVERVKEWIGHGTRVKIFTARASGGQSDIKEVSEWVEGVFGHTLEITCQKDYGMIELWDDRAVQVIPNTGMRVDEVPDMITEG